MNLKSRYSIWPALVLAFGIVSCKKEKDMVYKPSPLQAPGMSAQNADQSFFKDKIPYLQAGGQLILDGLKDKDFSHQPVLLKIQSLCQKTSSPTEHFKESLWQNRYAFEVEDLLSEDLLLDAADEAYCDLTITLTDHIGSTNTKQLRQVKIIGIKSAASLSLPFLKEGVAVYQNVRDTQINAQGARQIRFRCDEIAGVAEVNGSFSLAQVLGETLQKKADLRSPVQHCRLLGKQQSSVDVSAPFILHVPVTPVVASMEVVPVPAGLTGLGVLPVLRIRLVNPNSFDLPIVMENPYGNQLLFRMAMEGVEIYLSAPYSRPLQFNISPQNAVSQYDSQTLAFTIKPKEEILVMAQVPFGFICSGPLSANNKASSLLIGLNFNYQFTSKFYSKAYVGGEQPIHWTVNKPALSSVSELPYWDVNFKALSDKFKLPASTDGAAWMKRVSSKTVPWCQPNPFG